MRPLILSFPLFSFAVFCFDFYYRYNCHSFLWLGVVVSFLSVVYTISKSRKETDRIAAVLLFAITLTMLSVFRTPLYGFGTRSDSSFNFQLSSDIKEVGEFDFGVGFERIAEYSYNPALNIWSVLFSEVSGLSLNFIAVLLFPIISSSILLLFYYFSIKSVLTSKAAAWACLIFTFNPAFIFFETSYSKEPFALMFFALCLYIIFRSLRKVNVRSLTAIGFLSAFMVVFAHQWTAYNLLVTIIVIWMLPLFFTRFSGLPHKSSLLKRFFNPTFYIAAFILVLSWFIFIEFVLFSGQVSLIKAFFTRSSPEVVTHTMPFLSLGEKVMVYMGYLFFAILGAKGFFSVLFKKIKTSGDIVFLSWFSFCAVYITIYTYFLPETYTWASISQRGWIFAFFGLAPLVAISFAKNSEKNRSRKWIKNLKKVFLILLILPLVSAILLAPQFVLDPTRKDPDYSFYITATWMKKYDPDATVAADFYTWHALVPNARVKYYVESSPYTSDINAFVDLAYNGENFDLFRDRWKTFVFNKDISLWFNVSADPSMFDNFYNKVYDSKSLSVYSGPGE